MWLSGDIRGDTLCLGGSSAFRRLMGWDMLGYLAPAALFVCHWRLAYLAHDQSFISGRASANG